MKLLPGQRTCPKCGGNWDGELIADVFKAKRDRGDDFWASQTDEEIEAYVAECYSPPYRFGRELGVEVLGGYDGVAYWQCPDCEAMFDRFAGEMK